MYMAEQKREETKLNRADTSERTEAIRQKAASGSPMAETRPTAQSDRSVDRSDRSIAETRAVLSAVGADCFPMTATTLAGVEPQLAEELRALGAQNIEVGRRAVSFEGDMRLLYKANYTLRTALRILKPIVSFRAREYDDLYKQFARLDWHRLLPLEGRFFIDTAIRSEFFTNSRYALYRLKDAIRDYDAASANPRNVQASKERRCDLCLHLHIADDRVVLSLDSSGESLHHRGYRAAYNEAPLNEVLAAAILLKAGYDGSVPLLDPMCGSGTFLIEGAMIASHTPAGRLRQDFNFMHWQDFDLSLWHQVRAEADSAVEPIRQPISGSDRNFKAIGIAGANVARAGFKREIALDQKDIAAVATPAENTLVVLNPPYGVRVQHEDLQKLYRDIGTLLKHRFGGCQAWVLASPPELLTLLGLKHKQRETLFNGELKCELRGYELFAGKHSDWKAEKMNQEDAGEPSNPEDEMVTDREAPEELIQTPEDADQAPQSVNPYRRTRSRFIGGEQMPDASRYGHTRAPRQEIQIFGSDAQAVEKPRTFHRDDRTGDRPRTFHRDDRTGDRPRSFHRDDRSGDKPRTFHRDDRSNDSPRTFRRDDRSNDRSRTFHRDDRSNDRPRTFHRDDRTGDRPRSFHRDDRTGDRPRSFHRDDRNKPYRREKE